MVEISEMKVSLPMPESVKISTRPASCLSRHHQRPSGLSGRLDATSQWDHRSTETLSPTHAWRKRGDAILRGFAIEKAEARVSFDRKVDIRLHGKGSSKLPWHKAGQARHLVAVEDSDQ